MTEDAVKTDPILEQDNKCVRCKKEIEPDANVCHHCGKHQNNTIYYINQFATFTALIMVIIAGAQVYARGRFRIPHSLAAFVIPVVNISCMILKY